MMPSYSLTSVRPSLRHGKRVGMMSTCYSLKLRGKEQFVKSSYKVMISFEADVIVTPCY